MSFRVRILHRAEQEYREILSYLAVRSTPGAEAWARAFDRALVRLEKYAESCPRAVEDDYVDFEVREILFKTRRGRIYRALFTIRGEEVMILHLRAPGQDTLTAADFES